MRILAIANAGGHFIQLMRLMPAFENNEVAFISSKRDFSDFTPDHKFYFVPDANRKHKLKIILGFLRVFMIVIKYRPSVIITTGAALGLMGIISGKITGIKTIWIDSIANAEVISMSGKIAAKFSDRSYTQWEHLSDDKFIYKGNVLS